MYTSNATALCSASSAACQRHSSACGDFTPSLMRGSPSSCSAIMAVKCSSAQVMASCTSGGAFLRRCASRSFTAALIGSDVGKPRA
jgi:hypothetical protein